ncbi:hypothetical protein C8Q77DRAFT_1108513 [Trametes polyzona]|nr:hypothetical protein C8Q77DRAFT_1108513 [Trametes polyzona]
MGPPANSYRDYSGDYTEDSAFSDPPQGESSFRQRLGKSVKRSERPDEDEDEYAYGTGAKRYKSAAAQNDHPSAYSGRAIPAHYPSAEYERAMTPAHAAPLMPFPLEQAKGPADSSDARQGLFRLLGHDLDIFVEGHADAYEQARKKWSECSVEEWTQGADALASRFGKMLDYVKDHMTSKLALYATLHTSIAEHKKVLSEQEQALKDARESLVREGGAVVGNAPVITSEGQQD